MMNDEQYDMGAYLDSAEEIARKKLAMYSELLNNISNFKKDFMYDDHQQQVQVPRELTRIPNPKKQ